MEHNAYRKKLIKEKPLMKMKHVGDAHLIYILFHSNTSYNICNTISSLSNALYNELLQTNTTGIYIVYAAFQDLSNVTYVVWFLFNTGIFKCKE